MNKPSPAAAAKIGASAAASANSRKVMEDSLRRSRATEEKQAQKPHTPPAAAPKNPQPAAPVQSKPQAAPKKTERTVGSAFMGTFLRTGCFGVGVYLLVSGMWPVGLIVLGLCLFLFSTRN